MAKVAGPRAPDLRRDEGDEGHHWRACFAEPGVVRQRGRGFMLSVLFLEGAHQPKPILFLPPVHPSVPHDSSAGDLSITFMRNVEIMKDCVTC